MISEAKHGLFAGQRAVPLEGVRIDAQLVGSALSVTVCQRYRNREPVPVEAVYVFPLEESAAVCGFAASVSGVLIRGQVAERDEAFTQYDDALLRGDGGFLLDQERPNVFTASVGNLRPGESVELQIRYVALAKREGAAFRITIPSAVAPRYVPQGRAPEVGQPDGERVNPEHWPAVPYGLALRVDVRGEQLCRVESPSHPVRTQFGEGGASVELSHDEAALDRDFVLLAETRRPQHAEVHVAREADGQRVAMVSFVPELAAAPRKGHEVTFLLDCSGSMQGESIRAACRALALCVRALGTEDAFNVLRFGSSHQALWPSARPVDDASLDEASAHIAQIEADLGGTELLAPLAALLDAPLDPARPRRVLLLTDGQVSNEDEVFALARKHATHTRIFTFGIGAGVSEHLVRGTARASRGAAEMIFPGERIEPKVLRMFERVRAPVVDDARIDWRGLKVTQAPARLPPLFAGEALTVFARVESGNESEVVLHVDGQTFSLPIDLEHAREGSPIPQLWAREALFALEDELTRAGSQQRRPESESRRRAEIVALAKRYGLMSSQTSFVAVEERPETERTSTAPALRRIPVALSTGEGARPHTMAVGGMLRASAPASFGAPPPAPAPYMLSQALAAPKDSARRAKGGASVRSQIGAAPAQEPVDPLFDVLMSQRADGRFTSSPALLALLGSERSLRARNAAHAFGEDIVYTMVLIALLERDFADRESEWRPAREKARGWLATHSSAFGVDSVLYR